LLRDEDLPDAKRETYTNHIENAGDTLLNLIDDIIDIAKIEAGQLKISYGNCDLSELMDGLLKTHTEQKNKKEKQHINLIPNGDNVNENLVIKTDCHRLTQILNNIIGNALKFTEEGYVRFGYLTVSDETLQFYVKDSGIGIPDSEKDSIFDRFRRLESDEKIYQGTGLGLAITKNLVELLGGKLWVDSEEDMGSTFYFTLPYEIISKTSKTKKKVKKPKEFDWTGKTILIAEDEKLNYTYLAEVLLRTNATVIWAKTGSQAINLYRKHKRKINIILMDIKMPNLSGYEVMQIIRKTDKDIPLIVQTAHVISGERDKSFEAGCDEYLTKPLKADKLLNTLHKYISYEPNNSDRG
jgi:CheY-like chemotaxis protein